MMLFYVFFEQRVMKYEVQNCQCTFRHPVNQMFKHAFQLIVFFEALPSHTSFFSILDRYSRRQRDIQGLSSYNSRTG